MDFVAIDFETADTARDSACAVGLARVRDGRVAETAYTLIRPPQRRVRFTEIHGITWADVRDAPVFGTAWPQVAPLLEGAAFLAAHHAPFDRSVLRASCRAAGLLPPPLPFLCTVRLARQTWGFRPARLNNVCEALAIPLQHHHALSDALACAEIVLAAARTGGTPADWARCFPGGGGQ